MIKPALLLATTLAAISAAAGNRIRLAVSTYSYWHFKPEKYPIEKVIEDAARLGFDGVEVLHPCGYVPKGGCTKASGLQKSRVLLAERSAGDGLVWSWRRRAPVAEDEPRDALGERCAGQPAPSPTDPRASCVTIPHRSAGVRLDSYTYRSARAPISRDSVSVSHAWTSRT